MIPVQDRAAFREGSLGQCGSVPQTEEQEAEEPETGKMVPLSGFICPGTAERMVLRMVGRSPAGVAEAAVPSLVSEDG